MRDRHPLASGPFCFAIRAGAYGHEQGGNLRAVGIVGGPDLGEVRDPKGWWLREGVVYVALDV